MTLAQLSVRGVLHAGCHGDGGGINNSNANGVDEQPWIIAELLTTPLVAVGVAPAGVGTHDVGEI